MLLRKTAYLFITLVFVSLDAHSEENECKKPYIAKSNFIETCTGYMEGRALSGGGDVNRDKINSRCRCVARNFHVENIANKKCEFDVNDIEIIMRTPKTKVICD